jgi:aspartyl/asparaginyl beta-hydroxylase (cupin superfamily)
MIEQVSDLLRRSLNTVFYRSLGGDRRPVFFETEATFPGLLEIDRAYDEIRAELMAVLPSRAQIPRYHELDEAQRGISEGDDGSWRVLFVRMHNVKAGELPNSELCPRAGAAVDRVPDVLQAFFSILEPGKSVPSHNGPYLGYLRYHTGFVVPTDAPPRLRVKDRYHTWEERVSLLFDDSWNHEVENESDGVRVVLIVDVLRPMAWPLRLLNRFARRVFFSKAALAPALAKMKPIRPAADDVLEPAPSARG